MSGAGRLRERVMFREPRIVVDSIGGTEDGFIDRFELWAGYTRLRGSESVMAARLSGRQPTVIRVRRSSLTSQVTTGWAVRDQRSGEQFAIRSKVLTDNRLYFDLMCESGVAV